LLRDWAFNNTGDDFVTVNADKTQIEIDGVLWEKGKEKSKKINRYSYNGEIYDNVGRNVPEPITEFTQIVKIDFGGSEPISLNFIDQHSSFFMIFNSKSDNAKILGRIAGIDKIYKCVKLSSQKLKKNKGLISTYQKNIEEDKEELKQYDFLVAEETFLKEIKENIDTLKTKEQELIQLEQKVVDYNVTTELLQKVQIQLDTFPIYENIYIDKLIERAHKIGVLENLIKEYNDIQTRISSLNVKQYETLTSIEIIKSIDKLESESDKLQILEELIESYDSNNRKYNSVLLDIQKYENGLQESKTELEGYIKDLHVCPITLDIMPEECKEKIRG
jgi:DNA repair exonuclease SbcCD ATPase subunit